MRSNTQIRAVRCLVAAAIVLVGLSGSPCLADLFSGSLSYPTTIVAGPTGASWQSSPLPTITWVVTPITDYDSNPDVDYFNYAYTFTAHEGQGGGLSHLILEVSTDISLGEIWGLTPETLTIASDSPRTYGTGAGNPGIPGDIFGIKIQTFTNDGDNAWAVSFNSMRVPVWGDFYAKGGSVNYAYNVNFGVEWDELGNPTGWGYLAVPDTYSVPVPAAVLLGILGLGVAGWKLRRFA